jgi:virginiamycin A acetyltransferase
MIKQLFSFAKKIFGFFANDKVVPIIMKGSNVSEDSSIGNYTYIGYNCNVTKSSIGRYCSIANNVTIGSGEHIIDEISTSSLFYEDAYSILTKKDCVIGNDVWIGVDSIIRRGVTIGNGAIIGANSFVNVDVPEFAIVVGSPAKVVRYRFDKKKGDLIKESQWWNSDPVEAKKIIYKLKND